VDECKPLGDGTIYRAFTPDLVVPSRYGGGGEEEEAARR